MNFPKVLRYARMGVKKQVNVGGKMVEVIVATPQEIQPVEVIAQHLGATFELVPASDRQLGNRLQNGSWTGVLGMLQRGEADAAANAMGITSERFESFQFTYPNYQLDYTFMTRKHVYVPDNRVFLHPFSKNVWVSVIVCAFVMPFIFRTLMGKKYSPATIFTSTVASLLRQGIKLRPQKNGEYFLLASWLLGVSLFGYFYSAVLLSFLSFPTLQGIRTIEDLANGIRDGKYQCSSYPGTFFVPEFLASNDTSLQVIGRDLQQSKGTHDMVGFLESFEGGKIPVFINARYLMEPYEDLYFISEDSMVTIFYSYPIRKEFCCAQDIRNTMRRMFDGGILRKITVFSLFDDFLKDMTKHKVGQGDKDSGEKALTMSMFMGPFLFLAVSHAFSFLVFLIELCVGNFNKMKTNV